MVMISAAHVDWQLSGREANSDGFANCILKGRNQALADT